MANLQNNTDAELLQSFKQDGERKALGTLYQRYAHLVLGLCLNYLKNKEDARDAVMDIFEKASRKLPDQQVENFKTWIFYVSRNHCIDLLRRRVNVAAPEFSQTLFVESESDLRPLEEDRLDLLPEALNQLKQHQRDCLVLFYLKGKSYDEVAKQTGYAIKEVKSFLQNGRRNLKNTLLKLENERAKGQQ